jgi:ergosteryl-3beta-O-L-aspartate synthase
MLLLNLGNIRFASLFPRDPKSFPEKPRQLALRHEEASTSPPPWKLKHSARRQGGQQHREEHEYQPLEKLIANYGDASNTSWLDERYKVWRHEPTGAAIGYVLSKHDRFAIIVGNPLCACHQYSRVIHDFLRWLKETHLKPLWILVDSRVEEVLGGRMGWSTLTCAAEERVNNTSGAEYDREVRRKIRHAKSEGITVSEVEITEEIQKRCDERIKEWLENRKGKQIHLTNINPWLDPEHRRYFLAEDSSHKIHSLVVLAQLSSEHGYQVKYSLDFPGAPSGTIEYIITAAMEAASESGAGSITFGAAASSNFTPVHHLNGMRVKMLKQSYNTIAQRLSLINKSEFREKLGAEQDAVYICYPKHGLGTSGVKVIMEFFSDEE